MPNDHFLSSCTKKVGELKMILFIMAENVRHVGFLGLEQKTVTFDSSCLLDSLPYLENKHEWDINRAPGQDVNLAFHLVDFVNTCNGSS